MKTVFLFLVVGLVTATPQGGLPARAGNAQYASDFSGGETGSLPAAKPVETYEACQGVLRTAKEYSYAAICPKFPRATAAQNATLTNTPVTGSLPAATQVQTYEECQNIMRTAKEYMYAAICPKFPKAKN